jgi:hypothetical protein
MTHSLFLFGDHSDKGRTIGERTFKKIPKEVDQNPADKHQYRNKQLNIRV